MNLAISMNSTMESLLEEFPWLFYLDVLWLSLMTVIGAVGNSAALCAAAMTPSLRTPTQLHITILAGADWFITVVVIPCRIATEYYSGAWPRHESMCHTLAYLAIFLIGFSLQQLVYLAQVRYLRVARSDALYRRFTSKPAIIGQQMFAIITTCVLTLLPLYSSFGSVGYNPNLHFCMFTGDNQFLLAVLSVVGTMGMIPTYYGLTFLHVRAHRKRVGNWGGVGAAKSKTVVESLQTEVFVSQAEVTQMESLPRRSHRISSSVPAKDTNQAGAVTPSLDNSEQFKNISNSDSRLPKEDADHANAQAISAEVETTGISAKNNLPISNRPVHPAVNRPEPPAPTVNRPVPAPPADTTRKNKKTGISTENVKISRNLMLIFCGYIICWLPWCIMSLMEPYTDIPIPIHHVITNMVWTNSCVNPYLYAFTSRNYRKAFIRCVRLKFLFKRNPVNIEY